MAYELTSKELVNYIYHRVYDPKFRGHRVIDVSISEDWSSLILSAPKSNKAIFSPSFIKEGEYDKIEIMIEPNKAGVNSHDVAGFLEKLVKDDKIFEKGQPLFSYERQKKLQKWKAILEMEIDVKNNKIACSIVDKNVSTERLRKTVYEYMFRSCLYYLFNLGNFS